MPHELIVVTERAPSITITLNDPDRRNALGLEMFAALRHTLKKLPCRSDILTIKITGNGPTFCSGFDLRTAAEHPAIIAEYIEKLSRINRLLRRLPQIVVAIVQGAALAGGCAILGACDFIYTEPNAKLGYPVHRLGISPAVTIPTLQNRILPAHHRGLLLSDRIVDAATALKIGLVTHLADSTASLPAQAQTLVNDLNSKGPSALRTTKAWLNELDGSLDDDPFNATVAGSASLATQTEAIDRLHEFWQSRT